MTLFHHDPHDYLCDTYDTEQCQDIVNHGCISGCATSHITYKDTNEFFDEYEDRITARFDDIFDESIVKAAVSAGMDDIISIKNWCTWWFIEDYAQMAVDAAESVAA